jgi:uncharacterized protein (TIGR02118 family)
MEIEMPNIASRIVYVSYQGTSDSRFDRRYYVEHHLPLVMQAWQRYGLESVAAFFPALAQDGTIAICECRFRDEAAIQAAFGSPETPGVMADLPKFTDLAPTRLRAVSL